MTNLELSPEQKIGVIEMELDLLDADVGAPVEDSTLDDEAGVKGSIESVKSQLLHFVTEQEIVEEEGVISKPYRFLHELPLGVDLDILEEQIATNL